MLQTRRKCLMASPLIEAAVDREGRPLFFHSREQLLLLQIFKPCTLIPVMGCNLEALNRKRLLAAIEGCCRAECLEDLRFHIIYDAEIPVYLSIKGNPKQILAMKEAISPLWVQKWGGIIHRNGRNMALLPPYADKGRAVRYVMELIREYRELSPLFIGMGDSLTDISFLRVCHYALTPQNTKFIRGYGDE